MLAGTFKSKYYIGAPFFILGSLYNLHCTYLFGKLGYKENFNYNRYLISIGLTIMGFLSWIGLIVAKVYPLFTVYFSTLFFIGGLGFILLYDRLKYWC